MLTGLKVSTLSCKCVFYRPEHNAKGERNEIEFSRFSKAKMKYANG